MKKCSECDGKMKELKAKTPEGVKYDYYKCEKCGEEYLPDESLEIVESKLKENNLWGVERKEVQFWKSGSSVVLRLPTKITTALGLDKIKKGHIYSEGRNKIVVEI